MCNEDSILEKCTKTNTELLWWETVGELMTVWVLVCRKKVSFCKFELELYGVKLPRTLVTIQPHTKYLITQKFFKQGLGQIINSEVR